MVELQATIALIAARLNDEARSAVIDLLAGDLQGEVVKLVRQVDPEGGDLEEYQRQMLQGFIPPVEDEEAEVEVDQQAGIDEHGSDVEPGEDEGEQTLATDPNLEPVNSVSDDAGLVAVLAMLCAAGPKHVAADLLIHLPLHLQGQIIPKLLKTSPLNATSGLIPLHREVVEALRGASPSREEWGVEPVCQILRSVDSTRQLRRLLTTADDIDHESVVILQNHLFNFEDLLRLSARDQQALLVQVDNQALGQALLMTEERVHKGLLANVSARRRSMIVEEEQRWSESTIQEIEIAQQGMLALARHLYEQGKITTYFGSVSRKGIAEFDFTEQDEVEEEVDETQEEEWEEEESTEYKGLIIGGLVLVIASAAIWGLVSLLAVDGGGSRTSGKRSKSGKGGIIATESGGLNAVVADGAEGAEGASSRRSGGQSVGEQAIVELPGLARVEALQATEIEAVDEDDDALVMRVGKMRTRVLDEDFEMRTPVVSIRGVVRGAVFDTRVVLDAGTTVEVVQGMVEVHSLLRKGQQWRVEQGGRGYFDTAGNARIEKK